MGARWLAGKAQFVQHWIHEVAGAIACEGAAGAVGSVSAGSEAEDQDAGERVSEAGNGAGPESEGEAETYSVELGVSLHLNDSGPANTSPQP